MADGESRALLPAVEEEEGPDGAARGSGERDAERTFHTPGFFVPPTPPTLKPHRQASYTYWRRAFLYNRNADFAVSYEISFRGAVCLILVSIPTIFGMASDPESWFHKDNWQSSVFHSGAILTFVYNLSPTFGRTISNVGRALAGSFTAAAFSFLMYLVYPNGCSGAEAFDLCFVFGVLAGAASIICCLLLDIGTWFHLFYCANFLSAWMVFLDPGSQPRNPSDYPQDALVSAGCDKGSITETMSCMNWTHSFEEDVFGFEFKDWGSGGFEGLAHVAAGASLAVLATLLPMPMTSMERARDCAFDTVNVIETAWESAVDFYVADDRSEARAAKMARDMSTFKQHVSTLKERLDNCFWEIRLLGACCSWRLKHTYLTQLEVTTASCLGLLRHVAGACMREEYNDVHDEMMRPERCGNAIRDLVKSTNALLNLSLECADSDGIIGAGEREELQRKAGEVREAELALSRQVWESMASVNRDIVNRLMEQSKRETQDGDNALPFQEEQSQKKTEDDRLTQITQEQFYTVAQELSDEQVFMFCLCHYASGVQEYSTWLTEHDGVPTPQPFNFGANLRKAFSKGAIMAPANVNYALRHSLGMFIGFAIGYVGYSETIVAKNALIPTTIAVLVSKSISAPRDKSMSRLLGVVLGKFSGKLAYALLGWCAIWAQVFLSTIVFAYVWFTLFLYHFSGDMFSYLGLIAAAFGTKQFLGGSTAAGCSEKVVTPHARNIVAMLISIVLMMIIDFILKMGSPSDLAYEAYLEAFATWDSMLEDLLSDEDTRVDPAQITTFIDKAETFGRDAASEPRYSKLPFPAGLFSEMIDLAKEMRTQVICIHEVICEKNQHEDSTFSKRQWFKQLVANNGAGWKTEIAGLLEEIDTTYDMIRQMAVRTGNKLPNSVLKRIRREENERISRERNLKSVNPSTKDLFATKGMLVERLDMGAKTVSLIDDEMQMANFVYGCLKTIRSANVNLQLEMVRSGY